MMGLHNKSYNTSNFIFLNIVFKNGVILIILNHPLIYLFVTEHYTSIVHVKI